MEDKKAARNEKKVISLSYFPHFLNLYIFFALTQISDLKATTMGFEGYHDI